MCHRKSNVFHHSVMSNAADFIFRLLGQQDVIFLTLKLCVWFDKRHQTSTYIDCLSDFQWFSFPAVNEQISHCFIVDLHVRNPEKELLLWTLWAKKKKKSLVKTNCDCTTVAWFNCEIVLTFLMVWKTSSTASGITPGKRSLPIMVKVLPEEVCP